MIDINTYRARIGMYGPKNRMKNCRGNRLYEVLNSLTPQFECLVFVLYIYCIIYFATVAMLAVVSFTGCIDSRLSRPSKRKFHCPLQLLK